MCGVIVRGWLTENTNSAHNHSCLSKYLSSTKEIQLRFSDMLDSEKKSSVKISLAAHTFNTKKQSNIPSLHVWDILNSIQGKGENCVICVCYNSNITLMRFSNLYVGKCKLQFFF